MGQSKRALEMHQEIALAEQRIDDLEQSDIDLGLKRNKVVELYKERAGLKKRLSELESELF